MADSDSEIDYIFVGETILPDASGLFEEEPLCLEDVINDADIVLDTSVLLIPFGAAASSLQQIGKVYADLKKKQKLFIPAQVAREFVKNRPSQLAHLDKSIGDQISRLAIPDKFSYPILESSEDFQELNQLITKLVELKPKIKAAASNVRSSIKNWGANDPVSQAYRPIFTHEVIITPQYDQVALVKEMRGRYKQAIPPGYKDASKPDEGVGDYLIWKTILHLGEKNKNNLVFVSGDEKADWMHGSDGSGFMTRYELKAEYRRASDGKDFFIIPLSRLMELLKAEESSVKDIKTEEDRIRAVTSVVAECPECQFSSEYDLGESIGSTAQPKCGACHSRFYLHRTNDGIIVRCCPKPSKEKKLEVVDCPSCGTENIKELGVARSSTAWCVCDECETKFPIHRRYDGSVFVSTAPEG